MSANACQWRKGRKRPRPTTRTARVDYDALNRIARIFQVGEDEFWPSGADVAEWVAEIVRSTGRRTA